jgi:aspartokinase/homoserine dehydrogenase 1
MEDIIRLKMPQEMRPWDVHKFGGASLATAELYRTVGDLLVKESAGRGEGPIPTMAIVSAMGGMTDLLIKVVDSALTDFGQAQSDLEAAVTRQLETLRELAPESITAPIETRIRQDAADIASIVQSLRMIHTVPSVTMEVVTGFGEIWSAQTLHAYLMTLDVPCEWIDARDILVVKSETSGLGEKGAASTGGVTPLYHDSSIRMAHWWDTAGREAGLLNLDFTEAAPIVVVTGFVATTVEGVPTTLKRSGSDFSATIFAKLTKAERVTMWKNTDGVYTADPRRVPDAFPIPSLKYDEAMELAYFGAQVLHPSAMTPCIDDNIPVFVRNIFNPSFKGTIIQGRSPSIGERHLREVEAPELDISAMLTEDRRRRKRNKKTGQVPIKGITSIDKAALLNLEGAAAMGGVNVVERFMKALSSNNIDMLMITQASAESSLCVAVPENRGKQALKAVEEAFELELARSTVDNLSLLSGMSVLAIVGEGMCETPGVSATFMRALASAGINVRLIAQGSSERQVAVCVDAEDASRALRAVHSAFTLSETVTSVAIIGSTGRVGASLISQLQAQSAQLIKKWGLDVRVIACTSGTKMCLYDQAAKELSLDLSQAGQLVEDGVDLDLDKLTESIMQNVNPHSVIIDCSTSNEVSSYYERWLGAGFNVISPSKMASAGPISQYNGCWAAIRDSGANWLYEASVGSALPIIGTLRDLLQTGDKVRRIEGSVSGTLAYALRTFNVDDKTFSQAMNEAVSQGYSEPDVRGDLSGEDTVRKVVIMAREVGLEVDMEDVEVVPIIPPSISDKEYPPEWTNHQINEAVIEDLEREVDGQMHERLQSALDRGMVLRYRFEIEIDHETESDTGFPKAGTLRVFLDDTGPDSSLFRLKKDENLVAFHTDRYNVSPLIVKGSAAGPDLAASGCFADLLRLARGFRGGE